jgi:drug/metabolite transporter (DMT)-like permease
MNAGRYLHAGLFVLLAVLWGFSFVAIKTGLGALPPVFFAALRFDVAVPLLLAYIAWHYDTWVPQSRADYAGIAVGALALIAGNNGFLFLGQQSITPAAASVMYGLNPLLAPAFAFVLLDQRLDAVSLGGIAVGLVGVAIIVQPSPETLTSGSTVGQLLVLAAAASVALGSVLLRRVDATLDSIPLTAWAMALGAAILHAVSVGLGESAAGTVVTTPVVYAVLVLGVLSTAVAYPHLLRPHPPHRPGPHEPRRVRRPHLRRHHVVDSVRHRRHSLHRRRLPRRRHRRRRSRTTGRQRGTRPRLPASQPNGVAVP